MFANDRYARAALFPRFEANGLFSVEALLTLSKKAGGDWYALSLCNCQLAKGDDGVHRFGCHAAAAANERMISQLKPGKTHKPIHYVGFYSMKYGSLMSTQPDYYDIKLRYVSSEGDSHFNLELWFRSSRMPNNLSNRERSDHARADRVAYMFAVSEALFGPARGTCEVDADIADKLGAVVLPKLPQPSSSAQLSP